MKVAIIGAGLIGRKRAQVFDADDELVYIHDSNPDAMNEVAETYNCTPVSNIGEIISAPEIECIIVSVVNKYLTGIASNALEAGKHVLVEKPLGRNAEESRTLVKLAKKNNCLIKTGFNHRFHPGIMEAKRLISNDRIGKILNIRAHYGHGGRPGMENEWRCSKELCGGGELLDQGVHLIDLCRWMTDLEVLKVFGKVYTSFWDIEVEDNAFFNLFFDQNIVAQCHVSWTNWRNSFLLEIFGDDGYVKVNGLGGSYGIETLEFGLRNKQGGRPLVEISEFDAGDDSWRQEWREFKSAINNHYQPIGNGHDGLMANQIIENIYLSSSTNSVVSI
jgi:predicted dehydrogenase